MPSSSPTESKLFGVMSAMVLNSQLVRIENTILSGIPDVAVCCQGRDSWVELKINHGGYITIRPSQVNWIRQHWRAGGESYILCCDATMVPFIYRSYDLTRQATRRFFQEKSKTFKLPLNAESLHGWNKVNQVLSRGFTSTN